MQRPASFCSLNAMAIVKINIVFESWSRSQLLTPLTTQSNSWPCVRTQLLFMFRFPVLSLGPHQNQRPQSHHFQVMAHTRSLCEAGAYTVNDEQWMLPHPSPSFAWKPTDDSPTTSRRRTEVKVSNHCSLTAAQLTRQASKHGRILVLNMANRTNPGGRCEKELEVGTVGKR